MQILGAVHLQHQRTFSMLFLDHAVIFQHSQRFANRIPAGLVMVHQHGLGRQPFTCLEFAIANPHIQIAADFLVLRHTYHLLKVYH